MFYIKITGKIAHKRYIRRYINDILHHYFKNRIKRFITININIVEWLDGDQGQCLGTRDHIDIHIATVIGGKRNRKRRPKLDQILETLAHELIHAKQYLRGEINQRNLIWRGDRGPYDCKCVTYRHTPWEKEAYNQEKDLKITYWDKQYKQCIK